MIKFQNKYRIPSARLQNWDYGANGAYFITICTDKMQHYFGAISECELQLNELGKLAHQLWEEIANQFPYVELGNFIIMPNHVHGILIINKSQNIIASKNVQTRFIASDIDNEITQMPIIADENVETRLIVSVPKGGVAGDKNPMMNENISRIIRWYKGRCSFEMRKIHADFSWHSRFHDHIIRDSKSFENIQNYIENNPSKWEEDKFYR
jgi:REP element-mobilizing transposase RayT